MLGSRVYGKPFIRDGVEYVRTKPLWFIPIYRLTGFIQLLLWKRGIPWHNRIADECTPDFNCCMG
jgi:hypothetical protein